MCKVSVIMPSYNVAKYIGECLESVVNQSLQDIEIICIDAGSTDGTREILAEFAKRDSRIKIVDSDKKSFGYQENQGIALARGEYIGFVETDDYIEKNMFELLYDAAKKNNLDSAKCNYYSFINVDEKHRVFWRTQILGSKQFEGMYNVVINGSDYPEIMWRDNSTCNGIYKTQFLRDKNILLNETPGAAYQDWGLEVQIMCKAGRMMYIEDGLYNYRKDNENSSIRNPKGLVNLFNEFLFVKDFLINNSDNMCWHWWMCFARFTGSSVKDRVARLLLEYGELPEEMDSILDKIREEYIWGMEKGYLLPNCLKYSRLTEIRMLIEDKRSYLQRLYYEYKQKQDAQQLIIEKAENWNKIIIFGAGLCGNRLYILLHKNGVKSVVGFCDNDEKMQKEQLFGKDILSLEESKRLYPDALYIIANEFHYMDIARQLKKADISNERIEYYLFTGMEY